MRSGALMLVAAITLAGCLEAPTRGGSDARMGDPAAATPKPAPTEALPFDGRPASLLPIALAHVLPSYPDAKLGSVVCGDGIWGCQTEGDAPFDGTGPEWVFTFASASEPHWVDIGVFRNGTVSRPALAPTNVVDGATVMGLPDDPKLLDIERVTTTLRAVYGVGAAGPVLMPTYELHMVHGEGPGWLVCWYSSWDFDEFTCWLADPLTLEAAPFG